MFVLTQKLNKLVENIESRDSNDTEISRCLHEMAGLMIEDEQKTIDFFNNCNDSHARIIYWLCPLFDEIVDRFPSNQMINAMKSLIPRYPEDKELYRNIQYAVDLMDMIQDKARE